MRKPLRALICATTIGLISSPALSQDYPSEPVKIYHGFGAGGNADTVSRLVAKPLSEELGQPFVVEPKPGAGGNVASDFVAHSEPDGYTLQMLVGGHAVSGALYRSLNFDAVEDFTFIGTISNLPFFVAVQPGSYETMEDLVTASQEGRVKFGSAGVGTTQHLTGELLGVETGGNFLHIPYKGDAAAVTALLGGEVDMVISAGTSVLSQAKSGDVELLAVTWDRPWPDLPDLPTVGETIPGFNVFSWLGLGAPAGVDQETTATLNEALNEAVLSKEVQQKLNAIGHVPTGSSPEEMREMVETQVENWNAAIDAAGIDRK